MPPTGTTLKQQQRKRDVLMFVFGCVCTLASVGIVQNISLSTKMMMQSVNLANHNQKKIQRNDYDEMQSDQLQQMMESTHEDDVVHLQKMNDNDNATTQEEKNPPNQTNPITSLVNATITNVVQQLEQQTNTNTAAVDKLTGVEKQPKWTRYDGVVIATKIHGPQDAGITRQMICLLTAAYNQHLKYDILIFSTLPWKDQDVAVVQEYAGDAKVRVVADPYTLEERVANMTKFERDMLYQRCSVKPNEVLTWDHRCCEEGYAHCTGLGYAWQSEFRSHQIWTRAALQEYKYMFWVDSDALMTQSWTPPMDPMKVMVENDLVLFFDNFPKGNGRGEALTHKIKQVYNTSICSLKLTPEGHFDSRLSPDCGTNFGQVHGMMHITNLEFYRSELQMTWAKVLTSPYHFQRQFDDQIAVTVPAAILAPDRAWDMRLSGLNLSVWHNGDRDGKVREPMRPRGYKIWFRKNVETLWPEGYAACKGVVNYGGRR